MNRPCIGIMGFGKMPADCAQILLHNGTPIHFVLETEESRFSSLEALCTQKGIPYRKASRAETTAFLTDLDAPSVVLSANNNFIFPARVVGKRNLRIINFHGAVLPSYPGHGQSIPQWIVYNQERRHGVTWHLVNERIDAGNILCQETFEVSEKETAMSLMMRSMRLGIALFSRWWERFLDPGFQGTPQAENPQPVYRSPLQNRLYRKADLPNNGCFDLLWDYEHSFRFLRSMDYAPLQLIPPPRIELNGETYAIKRYKADPSGGKGLLDARDRTSAEKTHELFYSPGVITLVLQPLPSARATSHSQNA